MGWDLISPHFQWDGTLRDIYIFGTSVAEWSQVWEILKAEPGHLVFLIDGEQATPPTTVEQIFALRTGHSVVASYELGKQKLNCHFFTEEEVEISLDPRDVEGIKEVEDLVRFMAALGRATAKEILLTEENQPQAILARFTPAVGDVAWTPTKQSEEKHRFWKLWRRKKHFVT
jgi:hypothetical protein